MTPVRPPSTKVKRNPATKSSGVRHTGRPVQSVVIQQNTCTPLGIAIMIDAAWKNPMDAGESPVVNM